MNNNKWEEVKIPSSKHFIKGIRDHFNVIHPFDDTDDAKVIPK